VRILTKDKISLVKRKENYINLGIIRIAVRANTGSRRLENVPQGFYKIAATFKP
jgi:hypothetical protein